MKYKGNKDTAVYLSWLAHIQNDIDKAKKENEAKRKQEPKKVKKSKLQRLTSLLRCTKP